MNGPNTAFFDKSRFIRHPLVGISPAFFGFAFVKAWSSLALPYFSTEGTETPLPFVLSLLPFDGLFALFACALAAASVCIVPQKLRRILFPAATGALVASSLLLLVIVPDREAALLPAALAVVLASIVMISEKSLFSQWGSHQADPAAVKSEFGGVPFLQLRIDSLGDAYGLTQRETDVLRLLAEQKPNAVIAQEMYIAVGTVKAHIQHIYQKPGIHTRKELMDLLGTEKKQ